MVRVQEFRGGGLYDKRGWRNLKAASNVHDRFCLEKLRTVYSSLDNMQWNIWNDVSGTLGHSAACSAFHNVESDPSPGCLRIQSDGF